MSNTPILPDADVAEPIPDERYSDDAVGVPTEDEDGVDATLPGSSDSSLPSDVEPIDRARSIQKPM